MNKYNKLTDTQKDEVWNRINRLDPGTGRDGLIRDIYRGFSCPYCYMKDYNCICSHEN